MSHIPKFGDAPTSLARDAAYPAGDLVISRGRRDVSSNFGICDNAEPRAWNSYAFGQADFLSIESKIVGCKSSKHI